MTNLLDWFIIIIVVQTISFILVEGDHGVQGPGVRLRGPLHVVGGQVAAVTRQPGYANHPTENRTS